MSGININQVFSDASDVPQNALVDASRQVVVTGQVQADIVGGSVGIAGITDPFTHSTASVTTASTSIKATVGLGLTRFALRMKNVSDTSIWIRFDGSPAVVGQGIELLPGETITFDVPAAVPQSGVVGIHAGTGTKDVSVTVCDA